MHKVLHSSVVAAVACALLSMVSTATATEYRSSEFKNRKSHIPNVYICTIIGAQMKYEPAAYEILDKFERVSKAPREKATIWVLLGFVWVTWEASGSG